MGLPKKAMGKASFWTMQALSKGKMWSILIDAFSKWPEGHEMSETTSKATILQPRKIFAVQGLPELIITDNLCPKSLRVSAIRGEYNTTLLPLTTFVLMKS